MKEKHRGYWIPVLHAHLPFVKHPEYAYFLEEHWLFEAITESYIPLLMNMQKMAEDDIDFRITVSLSPPLLEMFADQHLMEKYINYVNKLIKLSSSELTRLKGDKTFRPIASFYNRRHKRIKQFFTHFLNGNVLNGFRFFRDKGKIDIITSCATHGLLPLLSVNPRTVDAQLAIAVHSFRNHLGESPAGIWLPECAYYDSLEELLEKYHITYFFLDTHGLMDGRPSPRYGIYAPVYTRNGIAIFGRDPLSSKQVWSAREGYPGDFYYRDFYRDIGFDLGLTYIKPFISPDGVRVFTGLKYYRVTGKCSHKEAYNPRAAIKKTKEHAAHFFSERVKQIEELGAFMERPPVVVSPYDAELFGHWWFEGPDFLYYVFKEISRRKCIRAMTPAEYLQLYPQNEVVSPSATSWGNQGYYDPWLNSDNDWIYRHLHYMADTMVKLADLYYEETDTVFIRLLNQLVRELMLAQSSDWAFLITTNSAKEYSTKRVKEHISNFHKLHNELLSKKIDVNALTAIEEKNSIFRDLDFRVYAKQRE